MSTADKTRLQLVDSIRKARTAGATPPAEKAESEPAPVPPAADIAATSARASESAAAPGPARDGEDPFHWGRRVWPD